MEVTFDSPTDITVVPERKKTLNSITINQMVDYPEMKKVMINTQEIGFIVLWEGPEYDAVGQWTDADVINRIKELYGN